MIKIKVEEYCNDCPEFEAEELYNKLIGKKRVLEE